MNSSKNEYTDATVGEVIEPLNGEEYVRWAYRLLLGREPDSSAAVKENPFKDDRRKLVQAMLASHEFHIANPSNELTRGNLRDDEFDIGNLRFRDKRWENIAHLRRLAKAVPMDNGTVLCKTLGKYKQYVSQSDTGFSPFVIMDSYYEYFITEFIARNVREGMTVMDIGANYGYYTLLMADLVGEQGRVIAFEPNAAAADTLALSIRVNSFDGRVSLDRRAIWNSSGEHVTFHVPARAATNARVVWPLDSRLPPSDTGVPDIGPTTIETIALDDFPAENVAFIKADIEGAEERLWQGAKGFLRRNQDIVLILEFNAARCHDPQGVLQDVQNEYGLRYLDHDSNVAEGEIGSILASDRDWMLVLSKKQNID